MYFRWHFSPQFTTVIICNIDSELIMGGSMLVRSIHVTLSNITNKIFKTNLTDYLTLKVLIYPDSFP